MIMMGPHGTRIRQGQRILPTAPIRRLMPLVVVGLVACFLLLVWTDNSGATKKEQRRRLGTNADCGQQQQQQQERSVPVLPHDDALQEEDDHHQQHLVAVDRRARQLQLLLPNGRADDHAYLIRYKNDRNGNTRTFEYLTQKAAALMMVKNNNYNSDQDWYYHENGPTAAAAADADADATGATTAPTVVRHVHVSHGAITVHGLVDIDAVLAADPDIDYAEPDGQVYALQQQQQEPTPPLYYYTVQNLMVPNASSAATSPPGTGLPLPLDWMDGTVDGQYQYTYTGRGVTVYVLDSGIDMAHSEFTTTTTSNRTVTCGLDLRTTITSSSSSNLIADSEVGNGDCRDGWGHGTHVASTIAGRTYGVAKDANLVAVKVLGDDGTARFSDVLVGLEYVYNITKRNDTTVVGSSSSSPPPPPPPRFLVNLSLGTPRVAMLLNAAVRRLAVDLQVPVIVAAGNGRADACTWSPASANAGGESSVLAVGALQYTMKTTTTVAGGGTGDIATSYQYRRVASSNFGPCVTLYAPGQDVRAAWRDNSISRNGTRAITGTSAAAPYVTGTAALYLERQPNLTTAALRAALLADAIPVTLLHQNQTGSGNSTGQNEAVRTVTTRALLAKAVPLPSSSPFVASP